MRRKSRQERWIVLLYTWIWCFLHHLIMAYAQQSTTPEQTAHVLLLFKQAITKDPSGALQSWVQPSMQEPNTSFTSNFCNWFGITCDKQNPSYVISIALPDCKLEGSLTPSIGDIASLVVLNISNNSFFGVVPYSLGMLSKLTTLKLFLNSFVGSIPASLGNCSSLVLLDIFNNSISGTIPSQLGALSSLKGLILSQNLIAGGFPSSIFNASALQFLDLSNNHMTGEVPDVGNFRSLLSLKLAANNLTGHIPGSFDGMMSLQGLDFSNNMLDGEIPSQLAACVSLSVIILSSNLLQGSVPARFGELQNLRDLQVDHNLMSGSIPSSLGDCKRMENFILSHNMFDGGIPISVASLPNLLVSFDLSNNLLKGPIPLQLGGMSQVLRINLAHNKLSGYIISELVGCSGLEFLDLSSNRFTDYIPQELGSLLNLKEMLNLSHNSLDGPIPDLQHLQNLRVLDFSDNELTGTVPSTLASLPRLMFLNLSFNNLSGCFPRAETFVSKHINSSWLQGNPRSCVPSLSPSCSLPMCSARLTQHKNLAWYIWMLLSMAFLGGLGIVIFFRIASTSSTNAGDDQAPALAVIDSIRFLAEDMQAAINSVGPSLIGSGASSDVFKVQLDDGRVFALKRFKPTARQQLFSTELDVLTNLRHRNLVRIKGYWKEGRAILLEYMDNGSLRKQLHEMPRCTLDLETRIGIARDIAEGLVYLHSYHHVSVIHCDLKSGNILLDKDFKAYLADFGLATYTVGGLTNATSRGKATLLTSTLLRLQGTVGYMAPEYGLFKTTPSKAGDVYSYGVVLLELLTRRQPGHGNFPPGIYSLPALVRSAKLDDSLDSVLDPELRAQIRTPLDHDKVSLLVSIGLACTEEDYAARPSMKQVVSSLKYHPTFRKRDPVSMLEGQNSREVHGELATMETVVTTSQEMEHKVEALHISIAVSVPASIHVNIQRWINSLSLDERHRLQDWLITHLAKSNAQQGLELAWIAGNQEPAILLTFRNRLPQSRPLSIQFIIHPGVGTQLHIRARLRRLQTIGVSWDIVHDFSSQFEYDFRSFMESLQQVVQHFTMPTMGFAMDLRIDHPAREHPSVAEIEEGNSELHSEEYLGAMSSSRAAGSAEGQRGPMRRNRGQTFLERQPD